MDKHKRIKLGGNRYLMRRSKLLSPFTPNEFNAGDEVAHQECRDEGVESLELWEGVGVKNQPKRGRQKSEDHSVVGQGEEAAQGGGDGDR